MVECKEKEADVISEKGEINARSSWGNPIEFVLSCLNYAVGLGNVWRFPYLCYRNGGGAFLITYAIMMIIMGMPIFLVELMLGQYSGLGPEQVFKRMTPIFSGLGYSTIVVITLVTIYYMVIVAWTVFYFFASFTGYLGYGSCQHDFNSIGCFSATEDSNCAANETYFNRTCMLVDDICRQNDLAGGINRTFCEDHDGNAIPINYVINRTLSTSEYFREYVLGIGDADWYNFGAIRWELFGCLFFAWVVAYLCVVKGVKTSGKAVYFTVSFPYVILTALVIQGCILEGAVDGILLYVTPQWERLLEVDVWAQAASQTFYSFGIGCGSLITLASYNNYNNNCLKDALIVTGANAFTSVYAGFAIFSMLGFLAKQMGVPVAEVATDGPGLAFVAYPEAILRLPAPTVWSLLFFFMLFVLGLGCQFAGVEAISCLVMDKYPKVRRYQVYLTLAICCSCFLLAIPMVFSGGVYIFTLLEWNTASWAIFIIGFAEVIAFAWCYGCSKFLDNMADMEMKLSKISRGFWWVCWVIITPLTLIGIFIFQMTNFSRASYEDYEFPLWADIIGWLIGITTLVPLLVGIVWVLFKRQYTGWDLFKPTAAFGPQCDKTESCLFLAKEDASSEDLRDKF